MPHPSFKTAQARALYSIRLSGMPAFEEIPSDLERWQVTMLVSHADKSSPAAQFGLSP